MTEPSDRERNPEKRPGIVSAAVTITAVLVACALALVLGYIFGPAGQASHP